MSDDLINLNVAPSEPNPGDVIAGKYQLLELIGRGGFGLVYAATNISINQVVALKVLLPEWATHDPELSIRFRREAVLASQLRHPNTITLYDYGGMDGGVLYMAMEFVDGRTLSTVLRDEAPVAPDRVVHILTQILSSLEEAHKRGIVHRDLKPGNIMLTEHRNQEFVKVLDFGIAKALAPGLLSGRDISQTLTQAGQFCGTPRYMAPEQFRNTTITPAADLYSLGLIAYEMLTGEQAVYGETMVDLIVQQVAGPDLRLPADLDMPDAVRNAVNQALRKTPRKRFDSAGAFRGALLGEDWVAQAAEAESGAPITLDTDTATKEPDLTTDLARLDTAIDDDDDYALRPTQAIGAWDVPDSHDPPPTQEHLDLIPTNHGYKFLREAPAPPESLEVPAELGDTEKRRYDNEDDTGTNPRLAPDTQSSPEETAQFDHVRPTNRHTHQAQGSQSADVTVDISRNELFAAELARDAFSPEDYIAPAAADAAQRADQTVDLGPGNAAPPPPRFASRLERNVRRNVPRGNGAPTGRSLTRRVLLSVGIVILFLVVVAISAQVAHTVWTRTKTPPAPVNVDVKPSEAPRVTRHERLKDPAGPRVSIRINSAPTGATVFEGERRLGRTPIDLIRTRGTQQRIRVVMDGFLEHSMTVDFDKGRVYPVKLRKR